MAGHLKVVRDLDARDDVDVEASLAEAARTSATARDEMERANKRLAESAEATRQLKRRRSAAIDNLFPGRRISMSKEEAFAEAQRRLGQDAFVWRVPGAPPATRFVIGVRLETLDKVKLAAAGAGDSWESALANQAANDLKSKEEAARKMALIEQISEVCHEANRAWTKVADKTVPVQPHWDAAPNEMKNSTRAGVSWRLANPDAPSSHQHEEWMRSKTADGWVYGPDRDDTKKTHPCMVAYEKLPLDSRKKDFLFAAIVMSLGCWENFSDNKVEQPEPSMLVKP